MRDPEGSLLFTSDRVVRIANADAKALPFLHSDAATQLVKDGLLFDYSFTSDLTLESVRQPFVTYPHEWCATQLFTAAQLTMELSRELLSKQHELKDASAWNIIFQGCVPIFCDLLSIRPIQSQQWWALGQYARHFVYPLYLSSQGLLTISQAFRLGRDGIQPEHIRRLLGVRRYMTSIFPLIGTDSRKANRLENHAISIFKGGQSYHSGLYEYLSFVLNRLQPAPQKSAWSAYTGTERHYADTDLHLKERTVNVWMSQIQPKWVLDLGCNSGEFSEIAIMHGANVIAIDQDEACISSLFSKQANSRLLHPVLGNICDLPGGFGLGGKEFPGLVARMRARVDCIFALAILHHLFITEGVHLSEIVALLRDITLSFLIIELIPDTDPKALHLASQRGVSIVGRGCEYQLRAFMGDFETLCYEKLPVSGRELHLLRRRHPRVELGSSVDIDTK